MVIEVNKDGWYRLDQNRVVCYFYVKKFKPWHKQFNLMFARCSRRIEIGIIKQNEGWP